jgi:NAD(P)-dependent dehydrogenase (short-subunit alcohol dehydrogenase family)
MLRGVGLHHAALGDIVSVIARRTSGLNRLADEAAQFVGFIHPIPVDYRDASTLDRKLVEATSAFGPIRVAICWIHLDAPEAPFIVANRVSSPGSPCRYFDVLGSAYADPATSEAFARASAFEQIPGLLYRQIILGFMVESGHSRWLTDGEICEGVIHAVERDQWKTVVGTVAPWSARP